jgi:cold shock protein
MPTGKIARMPADKPFAFIKPDDGGSDLFFHKSSCLTPFYQLREGHAVSFEVEQTAKGPRANDVSRI